MKIRLVTMVLLCLCAIPLTAQPQVGGGTCNSASLNGNYSFTLTGRAVSNSSAAVFSNAAEGIGTATFDGLSAVNTTLTENTNSAAGASRTLSGTYSIQANCIGTLSIRRRSRSAFTTPARITSSPGRTRLIT